MRLKLQAGNAKQGLWEEEIPFARPAGILEEHGHAFKHTSPYAGLKKTKKRNPYFKAKYMFTTISQSLVSYPFTRQSVKKGTER